MGATRGSEQALRTGWHNNAWMGLAEWIGFQDCGFPCIWCYTAFGLIPSLWLDGCVLIHSLFHQGTYMCVFLGLHSPMSQRLPSHRIFLLTREGRSEPKGRVC